MSLDTPNQMTKHPLLRDVPRIRSTFFPTKAYLDQLKPTIPSAEEHKVYFSCIDLTVYLLVLFEYQISVVEQQCGSLLSQLLNLCLHRNIHLIPVCIAPEPEAISTAAIDYQQP